VESATKRFLGKTIGPNITEFERGGSLSEEALFVGLGGGRPGMMLVPPAPPVHHRRCIVPRQDNKVLIPKLVEHKDESLPSKKLQASNNTNTHHHNTHNNINQKHKQQHHHRPHPTRQYLHYPHLELLTKLSRPGEY
jgi:hypothetical protein